MRFPQYDVCKIHLVDGSEIVPETGEFFQITNTYGDSYGIGICLSNVIWKNKTYKPFSLIIPITSILVIEEKK